MKFSNTCQSFGGTAAKIKVKDERNTASELFKYTFTDAD